jgi:hypothetical protein
LDWLSDDDRGGLSDGKDECTPAISNRAADSHSERVRMAPLEFRLAETLGAPRSRDGVRGRKRNLKAVLDCGQPVLELAGKAVDLGTKLGPHLPTVVALVENARHFLK